MPSPWSGALCERDLLGECVVVHHPCPWTRERDGGHRPAPRPRRCLGAGPQDWQRLATIVSLAAAAVSLPGEGIRFGDVAVKAATWSLTTMLLGSLAGGVLGERAHRRRHHGGSERAQSSGHGST